MKVCFPVKEVLDLESEVYGHFGSAPAFVFVDAETEEVSSVRNADMHHQHGMCNPIAALAGKQVDAVVVGGIGGGALMKLQSSGIRVYRAGAYSVKENLALFRAGDLAQFLPGHTCGSHGASCAH
jgi:predicted Fe-Mo cluster-binding NifX family protein